MHGSENTSSTESAGLRSKRPSIIPNQPHPLERVHDMHVCVQDRVEEVISKHAPDKVHIID